MTRYLSNWTEEKAYSQLKNVCKFRRDGMITPLCKVDDLDNDDWEAIDYLCSEWDYEFSSKDKE